MRLGRVGTSIILAAVYMAIVIGMTTARFGNVGLRWAVIISVASVGMLMLLQLAFAISIVALRMRLPTSAIVAVVSALLFAGTFLLAVEVHLSTAAVLGVAGLQRLLLMLFAVSLGYTVSFIIGEANILLPVAVFAACTDYWNVTFGPLRHILEKKPIIVEALAVQMPNPVPGMPGTMIGMGDFVFFALFFGVLYRFAMNVKGAFWLVYGLLTVSMLVVMKFGSALPALVPLGLAVVAANVRNFKLKREELLATVYVGALLFVFLLASAIYMHGR